MGLPAFWFLEILELHEYLFTNIIGDELLLNFGAKFRR